ncbi:hypothetical protein PHJA_000494100 [Phtheirospermum japonicum]|uniref:Uncharacterized protein n=1 Tax=Phtheirospermum japonicum TaxID=374723 RepID=A0A830B8T2_9LAMI|nr:hypothetical protein PHJA_000494100 [Phtheirospermum japonicum]
MSVSTLKPVACRIPPAIGASGPNPKVSKVKIMNKQALPPLQVRGREKGKLVAQESSTVTSRREMMQLTAASIGLLSLLLPAAPAEARPRNATMRQKIMEKLEELRQKAGLSKPKDEGEEKSEKLKADDKETKPKLKNGGEEKKAQNHNGEILSVPSLPIIINGTTVETTLP